MARSTGANWFRGLFNRRQEWKGKQPRLTRLEVECLEKRTVPTVLSTQLLLDHFDNNDVSVSGGTLGTITATANPNQVIAYCRWSSFRCTSSGPGLGRPDDGAGDSRSR